MRILGAGIAVACLALAAAGCTRPPVPEPSTQGTPLADIAVVAGEDETAFTDLPGVEGFERLSPALQGAVVARANRARCDCGCPGHSVNACLHQDELCDVALGLARGFVADAEVLALNGPQVGDEVGDDPSVAPAAAGEAGGEGVSEPATPSTAAGEPSPAPSSPAP